MTSPIQRQTQKVSRLKIKTKIIELKTVVSTESDEIEREEPQKWLAPLPTGHKGNPIWLWSWYHLKACFNRSGVTYQIFEFLPRAREMGPPSWGL